MSSKAPKSPKPPKATKEDLLIMVDEANICVNSLLDSISVSFFTQNQENEKLLSDLRNWLAKITYFDL